MWIPNFTRFSRHSSSFSSEERACLNPLDGEYEKFYRSDSGRPAASLVLAYFRRLYNDQRPSVDGRIPTSGASPRYDCRFQNNLSVIRLKHVVARDTDSSRYVAFYCDARFVCAGGKKILLVGPRGSAPERRRKAQAKRRRTSPSRATDQMGAGKPAKNKKRQLLG